MRHPLLTWCWDADSDAAGMNARINQELKREKLTLPIVTVGATEFFGPLVADQMRRVSEGVERSEVFDQCGHSLALEASDRLATMLCEFMLGR